MTRVQENQVQAQQAAVLVLNAKEAQALLNLLLGEKEAGELSEALEGLYRALAAQAQELGLRRSRHGGWYRI
ncbi:hypothetical protein [Thermus sp.]|uniref:hypothetical protein n=1 Tax=Thermus sp. TaxID=275 RepID=UPI003D12F492